MALCARAVARVGVIVALALCQEEMMPMGLERRPRPSPPCPHRSPQLPTLCNSPPYLAFRVRDRLPMALPVRVPLLLAVRGRVRLRVALRVSVARCVTGAVALRDAAGA